MNKILINLVVSVGIGGGGVWRERGGRGRQLSQHCGPRAELQKLHSIPARLPNYTNPIAVP